MTTDGKQGCQIGRNKKGVLLQEITIPLNGDLDNTSLKCGQ